MGTARHTFATSFQCNGSKVNKKGVAPICLSISIDGKRTLLQLDKKCKPEDFRRLMESRKGSDIKTYCDTIQAKVDEIHTYITVSNEPLTAQRVKLYLKEGIATKSHTIADVVAECVELKEKECRKNSTITKYRNSIEHFYELTGLTPNTEMSEVKPRDIQLFMAGLSKIYKPQTITKELKYIKHYFIYAFNNGYIKANPFGTIKISNKQEDQRYLTYDEIRMIRDARIVDDRLDRVRDLSLFMIFSGIEYADLVNLEKDDVKVNEFGQYYIRKCRVKSGIEYISILFEDAPKIWDYYEGRLPVISNQKFNKYLKELMKECGIENPDAVTTLTFRHSYGCYCINNKKLSTAITAKMMGHTNETQTRHYAKLFDTSVFEATRLSGSTMRVTDKIERPVTDRPRTRKKTTAHDVTLEEVFNSINNFK